jgi:hypothetical protein
MIKCGGCSVELFLSMERAPFCANCGTTVSPKQLYEALARYVADLGHRAWLMDAGQTACLDNHLTSIMCSSFMMRHLLRKFIT